MPLGIINTNVSSDSIPITFCEDLSKLLSEILEMPEKVKRHFIFHAFVLFCFLFCFVFATGLFV